MESIPADRFPRLTSYLASLPSGFGSYPECEARASLFSALIDGLPGPRPSRGELPDPVASLFHARLVRLWVPEVHLMALTLAVADHFQLDDAALLEWLRERNLGYFRNVVVRVLMAFMSPADFVQRAATRWGAVHRGSTLTPRLLAGKQAELELAFPPGLFAPLLLHHLTAVFQAALQHTGATGTVELADATDVRGLYRARWS